MPRGKVTRPIGTYQRSPSPTPFPNIRVESHPKPQLLLSQEQVTLLTSDLARTITGSILTEGSVGVSRGCAKFLGNPLLSPERVKLYGLLVWPEYSLGRGSIQIKTIKIWAKGSVGVTRGCPKFLGTPIISGTGKLWTSNSQGPSEQNVH